MTRNTFESIMFLITVAWLLFVNYGLWDRLQEAQRKIEELRHRLGQYEDVS